MYYLKKLSLHNFPLTNIMFCWCPLVPLVVEKQKLGNIHRFMTLHFRDLIQVKSESVNQGYIRLAGQSFFCEFPVREKRFQRL